MPGYLDFCETSLKNNIRPSKILEFEVENSVASNPTRVCICTNSTLNKDKTEENIAVFPGQSFEIKL